MTKSQMKIIHLSFPLHLPIHGVPEIQQVLAIGDFDGIHKGHQEVLSRAINTAKVLHLPAAIMTFHPHPRQVLGQGDYTQVLTPMPDKLEKFAELGVEYAYIVSFDHDFMKVSPVDFIESMLIPLNLNTVVVGFDFTFGFQGAGTPDTLAQVGHGRFTVEVVRPYNMAGEKVSSTLIREYLQQGNVHKANELLGERYSLRGHVIKGDGRGRTIGFPTANISLSEPYVIPCNGVYAIQAVVHGMLYNGVMNIGFKPTFASSLKSPTLEAHLFNFNQDIYEVDIHIQFLSFLRKEQKFAGVEQLVEQIHRDIAQAKMIMTNHH